MFNGLLQFEVAQKCMADEICQTYVVTYFHKYFNYLLISIKECGENNCVVTTTACDYHIEMQ